MENVLCVGSHFSQVNAIRMTTSQTVLDVLLGMSDVSISRCSLYEPSFSVSLSHGIRISLGEISGRGPVRRRGIRLSEAERGESVSVGAWPSFVSVIVQLVNMLHLTLLALLAVPNKLTSFLLLF